MKDVSRRSMRMARLSWALPRRAAISFWRSSEVTGRKSMVTAPFVFTLHSSQRRRCRFVGILRQLCQNQVDGTIDLRFARIDGGQLVAAIPIIAYLAVIHQ